MPRERLSMRKIREVLRLRWGCGLSRRKIAKSCAISRPTVSEYLRRAEAGGLGWPLPQGVDEAELERRLFPPLPSHGRGKGPQPDWVEVHRELKRKGVTLFLLWQEYKEAHPEGCQYSRFCSLYRAWLGTVDPVMRQRHRAGEKLFVDYAGQTVAVVNGATGEVHQAQIFVAVLGASNYTYAEATWSQELPNWIGSHVRAFHYFGKLPEAIVPDNLRCAVKKANRYEPDINPTYQDLATHYGVAVVPARVVTPRDKAKVEAGVLVVERWILARLRNHTFFSLSSLNEAIAKLLEDLNQRPFKKLPGSRKIPFEQLERPALKPLPSQPYEYAEWKKARVNIDYHVEVDRHYYSVPYQLVKQTVDVRLSGSTVELFHKGKRVTSHCRSYQRGRHSTVKDHMPLSHQRYLEWSPSRILDWASKTGPATAKLAEKILLCRPYPQQGYRSCLGLLRLGKAYGSGRLEAACARALCLGAYSYSNVQSILKTGLDRQPLPGANDKPTVPIEHDNIRGPQYYN